MQSRTKKRQRLLTFMGTAAVMALALTACSSGGDTAGGDGAAETEFEVGGAPTVVDQAAWDKIVAAGKEEGEVIIYRSLKGSETVFADFEAETGIKVTSIYGATGDTIGRLDQEIEAKVAGADMTMHASPGWFDTNGDNFLSLLVSPEQDDEGWTDLLEGNSYATIYSQPYSLAYRTTEKAPKGDLKALLDANPKAKIGLVDATIASSIAFQYEVLRELHGDEILDQMAAANYVIEANNTVLADNLAAGTYDYAYPNQTTSVQPLIANGAPIDFAWPTEAIAGSLYRVAAITGAPHPNASMVLMNWMMGKEGGASFVSNLGGGSVPLTVDGGIPWGEVASLDADVWTTEYYKQWLADYWTPRFG